MGLVRDDFDSRGEAASAKELLLGLLSMTGPIAGPMTPATSVAVAVEYEVISANITGTVAAVVGSPSIFRWIATAVAAVIGSVSMSAAISDSDYFRSRAGNAASVLSSGTVVLRVSD